jgi:hypothetical protein
MVIVTSQNGFPLCPRSNPYKAVFGEVSAEKHRKMELKL